MKEEDGLTSDEQVIADTFNKHFTEKIENLKTKTDSIITEDPLAKLKKRLENNIKRFNLKTVSEDKLKKAFKNIKKKKSSGSDSLTQEQLSFGAEVLTVPLQKIFNQSLSTGIFPSKWKTAVVTPVLKKGDKFNC